MYIFIYNINYPANHILIIYPNHISFIIVLSLLISITTKLMCKVISEIVITIKIIKEYNIILKIHE